MTNDTNTLNGALRELGETMAANLTTQGVASTWDEGLTTLAGKILDITPVPPTPSFDGISLTGNKNILSAADSEYVTLEAQLTDSGSAAAVSGETVTFTVYKDSDDSVVTTLTDDTDSTGLATVSYYGQGTGDIYIQAECTFVSEIYILEDALRYDECSMDNTSSYTSPSVFRGSGSPLFSFQSGYGYKVGKSSGNGDVMLPIYDITGLTFYKIEFDQYVTRANNTGNTGAVFYKDSTNYHELFYAIQSSCNFFNLTCVNGTTNYTNPSATRVTANTWMHYEITVENGSINLKVTHDDTILYQNTYTLAIAPTKVGVVTGWGAGYNYVKNIKVKAL